MKYIRIIGVFCILILFLTCCKNPESIDHNMEDDTSTDTGRQTSILRHEDSGDEYRIDINGVQADGISNISYTILCRYPQNENSFALLAENCIPEIDSGNVIHIPKSIPICSVYVPGDETFIPIYRMVKKGSDTWTTEYTSINKSESDIVDDLATSLTVTKTPGSEGRFVYSLEQRDHTGISPNRADHLLIEGDVFCSYFLTKEPMYDDNGKILPFDQWKEIGLGRRSFNCYNPGYSLLFKEIDCKEFDLDLFVQVNIHLDTGSAIASDLIPLITSGSSTPKTIRKNTDQGTMTFSVENEEVVLDCYTGTDESLTVPAVVDGYPVTTIGENAIRYSWSDEPVLKELIIPDSVKTIERYAIYNCNGLEELVIPEGVETIELKAISNCDNLEAVKIPSTLSRLASGAFSECSKLKDITISDNNPYYMADNGTILTKDGSILLYVSPTLSDEYTIPGSITEIGDNAFSGCMLLTEVHFPESLTSIGKNAFCNTRLKNISLPDSLESIEDGAFSGSIYNLYDDYQVEYTEDGESQKATGIPKLTIRIGKNVRWIGDRVFSGYCVNKFSVSKENNWYVSKRGLLLTKDKSFLLACPTFAGGELIIPEGVNNISSYAFENNGDFSSYVSEASGITKLILPESLEYFDSSSLPDTLEEISINSDIKEWDDITSCGNLKINGLDHLKRYEEKDKAIFDSDKSELIFYIDSDDTNKFKLPADTRKINPNALDGSNSVKTIIIPESAALSDMNDHEVAELFASVSSLEQIVVEEGNGRFSSEDGVLFDKDKSAVICYPAGKKETEYQIPEKVKKIYANGMRNNNLQVINVPKSLEELSTDFDDLSFFTNLDSLKQLKIEEENPYLSLVNGAVISNKHHSVIGYLYTNGDTVSIPEGVDTVSRGVFDFGYSDLYPAVIKFPESLKKIDSDNFNYLNTEDPWDKIIVYIPASVNEISDRSFIQSSALEIHVAKGSYAQEFFKNHMIECINDLPE